MAAPGGTTQTFRMNSDDLWALAVGKLSEDDKQHINFGSLDKVEILAELFSLTKISHDECVKKRWRFVRRNGEVVILRDLFAKIIKCLDVFKDIGDNAVQFDPYHAALPWAGLRLILQMAVGDVEKFGFIVEGCTDLSYLIDYYCVIEDLYLGKPGGASHGLKDALVRAYALILEYLCKSKAYFSSKTPKRMAGSVLLGPGDFSELMKRIQTGCSSIDQHARLVDTELHHRLEHRIQEFNANLDRHEATMRTILEDLKAPLQRMDDRLKDIQDNMNLEERYKVLQWVSPQPYIQHHEESKKGVLVGTGQWLLEEPDFKAWKTSSSSSVLWLHGSPGTGKSKLTSIVVEELQKWCGLGQCPRPAHFYCSRNPAELERSQPAEVLASIARQLSSFGTGLPLLDPVVSRYQARKADGFAAGRLRLDETTEMIVELVAYYPVTLIVIDALDECVPDQRYNLCDCIERILKESSSLVKIFVSSRKEPDLRYEIKKYPNLEISSGKNSEDIIKFVQAEVQRMISKGMILRNSHAKEDMKNLIVKTLVSEAGAMFRWVSLQLEYLRTMTLDSQIRERLGRLPPTLKELYRDIYEQRSLHEIERSIISKVFSWLLCAKELLNSSELLAVVSLGTAAEEDMSEEKVLELCSNFVVLDESDKAFQFAHLSLREFLEGLPEFSTTASNALLATSCLSRIMLASNFTGSWHLLRESFPELVEKLPTWPDPDLLLDYALRYWPYHCKLADSAAQHGALRVLMQRMLLAPVTPNCPFDFWMQRLLRGWTFREWSSRNDEVIYAQLRDSLDFWHSPQFVACAFGFLDIVQAQLSTNAFEPKLLNREGLSALAVATKYGHLDLLDSLLEREKTEVTEEILVIAAKNETHGPEALSFLLRRSSRFHLTLHLVLAAISNKERATDVLSILFGEQKGFEISEAILKKVVARNHCDEAILGFLLAHGGRNSITEAVLAAAAGNRFHAVNLVTLLLDENQNLQIMENVLVAAARNEAHAMKLMASLLKENKPLHITENVLVAAAGNRAYAMNLITSLLGESDSLQITKRVIWAAAEKIDSGEETFEYLIDRKPPTPVTEDLLEGVLKYSRYNSSIDVIKLMKLLIDRIQNFGVTERIVKAAVVNHTHSYNLLKYLLDHFPDLPLSEDVLDAIVGQSGAEEKLQLLIARGRDIKVTKRLLVAAAESDREPLRTLKFLFGLDRDIVCTETFIKAVGNGRAIQVLPWLLEQGKELPVTSAVVESVLSNIYGVTEVLKFLLDLDPDGYVEITEEAMKRAVQCEEEVLDFLKSTGRPLPITTSVMRAALERRVEVKAVLILDWLTAEGGHLVVTEQDLIAAAGRWWGGAASILGWLLDYDKEAVITEAVVAAAIWDIDALTVLLERGQRIMVTELVVQAALKYRKSGTKGMLLLLTAGCETTADARIFIMREFNRQVVSMLPNSEEAFAHYGLPAAAQNT